MAAPCTASEPQSPTTGWGLWIALIALVVVMGAIGGWSWHQRFVSSPLTQARTLSRHDERQAAAEYRRYLEYCPTDAAARLELATLLKRRDPDQALQELRKIPPQDANYVAAVRQVAALSIDFGRDYDAVEPLVYLAERLPDDARVRLALAELRFRSRDFEAALEQARQARERDPQLAEAWLVEAESLDELKRSTEMIEPLESALKIDPQIPQAHLNLAYAYQLVGRDDEAYEHVQWFLQRHPNSAAAHRTLALVQRARGQSEAALEAVQRSLTLRPNQLDATLLEVEILLYLRRTDEAYEQIRKAHQSHGAEQRILTLLVRTALLSGRRSESLDWQRQLDRLLVNTPEV